LSGAAWAIANETARRRQWRKVFNGGARVGVLGIGHSQSMEKAN
jgi:hypothetical protein